MFANEALGKTFAVEPEENIFVSPVNGTLEALFTTGHAYGVRGNDGTAHLVHIGIDTVKLRGKGFTLYKNKDDKVGAEEKIIKVDLNTIKQSNYDATTMLIITESTDGKDYTFAGLDDVKAGGLDK